MVGRTPIPETPDYLTLSDCSDGMYVKRGPRDKGKNAQTEYQSELSFERFAKEEHAGRFRAPLFEWALSRDQGSFGLFILLMRSRKRTGMR